MTAADRAASAASRPCAPRSVATSSRAIAADVRVVERLHRRGAVGLARLLGQRDAVGRRADQVGRDRVGARRQRRAGLAVPRREQGLHRRLLRGRDDGRRALVQGAFLDPAAREGVEREHVLHVGVGLRPRAPRRGDRRVGRGAGLVEQQQHGPPGPREDLHLRRDVARVLGALRRVHEVEDDVGAVADARDGLLRAEQRAVAEAVPDLVREPAERVALAPQPLQQPRRVAEPRRVLEDEPRAVGREHVVGLGDHGDVGLVEDLADVAAQERARERGLADVRVGHERERHHRLGAGPRVGHARPPADAPTAAASRAAAPASRAPRSSGTTVTPASRAIRAQSRPRSSTRAASARRSR